MRKLDRKGQILWVAAIAVLLIIVFAFLVAQFVAVRPSPIVEETFWEINGRRVTSVLMDRRVEAHVVLRATGEYVGSIVVKIRKDIVFWFDRDYSVLTVPVKLKGNERIEIELSFTPDEASGRSLRGYFIEVDFSVTRTKWVMENSYPPRLRVTETPTPLD